MYEERDDVSLDLSLSGHVPYKYVSILSPISMRNENQNKRALPVNQRPQLGRGAFNSYVSPRHRAQRTVELLNLGCHEPYPWQTADSDKSKPAEEPSPHHTTAPVTITSRIAEWDYGEYEGITSAEIRARRKAQGLGAWDIWRDGCPGGESPEDIIARVDGLIAEIREKYHAPVIGKPKQPGLTGDVMVVGHGHILRAFAIRWVGKPLTETALIMDAGGVGTLSYEHHSIDEPAILLGGGFVVGD
jgi:broad specificity phosphatase PhoE